MFTKKTTQNIKNQCFMIFKIFKSLQKLKTSIKT